jgi:hypothetical protein
VSRCAPLTTAASDFSRACSDWGEESEGIDGLPPARYREVQIGWRYRLERTDNAPDNRTWIVQSVDGSMTCTVKTQNTLSAFNLLDSGGVTFAVRKQSDSQFKYDGSLQATQHDSQNNITQAQFNFSFADGQLRQPIVFTGTLNAGRVYGWVFPTRRNSRGH